MKVYGTTEQFILPIIFMCISNLVYVFLNAFPFPLENVNSKISSSWEGFHIGYYSVPGKTLYTNEQTPVLYKKKKY